MFGYEPIYNEQLLGKVKLCTVNDILKNNVDEKTINNIIRAGVILYTKEQIVYNEVINEIIPEVVENKFPTHYPEIKLNPINKSDLQKISPKNNIWNKYSTYPQKNNFYTDKIYNKLHSTSIYNNRCSSIFTFVDKPIIVNIRPKLSDLCVLEDNIKKKEPKIIQKTIQKVKNVYQFCLGVDFKYETLTDFGGSVKRKENVIDTALREFNEENYRVLDYTLDEVKNSLCAYNNEIMIIFIELKIKKEIFNKLFNDAYIANYKLNKKIEMSSLKWFNVEELVKTINTPYLIFEPVREILSICIQETIKYVTLI